MSHPALFCIDDLSPIAWNDAAFDHLVLPGNEKQLSWDFVENKALANNNFDDFVQDKGEAPSRRSNSMRPRRLTIYNRSRYHHPHVWSAWRGQDVYCRGRSVYFKSSRRVSPTNSFPVAERARVPLYSMSAGTLGTVPKEVEAALDRALDLCKLWNAMLLLDEADVFLGSRNTADLARNELVAGKSAIAM